MRGTKHGLGTWIYLSSSYYTFHLPESLQFASSQALTPPEKHYFYFLFPNKYYFIYPPLLFTLFPCQLFQVSFSLLTGVLHLFMSLSQSPSCFPPCHLCLDRRLGHYGPKGRVWSLIITLKTDSAKMTVFPSAVSFPFCSLSSEKKDLKSLRRREQKRREERRQTLATDLKTCRTFPTVDKYTVDINTVTSTQSPRLTHLHGGCDFLQGRICLLLFSLQQCTLFCSPPLQLIYQRLSFVQLGHSCLQTVPQTMRIFKN